MEAVADDVSPRVLVAPLEEKVARAEADPASIMRKRLSYKLFDYADKAGAWSWGQDRNWCTPEARSGAGCTVRNALAEMSRLTWSEVLDQTTGTKRRRRKKHHAQPLNSICEEAQERWTEINRTEEELFRFRVGGKARIWGVRLGATFFMVWWDAEHKIYPVEKD